MNRLTKHSDHLRSWSELHGAESGTCAWNSHAIVIERHGPLIIVDPLPLMDADMDQIGRLGKPAMIFLTSAYHVRDAEAFRARWGCPVCIHELGATTTEIRVDRTVGDNAELIEGVRTIHLPGVYWPEETALLVAGNPPALIMGDALCGPRSDIDLPPGHVGMFTTKHVRDVAVGRRTLERLCDLDFELLVFGHGDPVRQDPRVALRLFLESDPFWQPG
jgi:hypothetical protein